VLCWFSCGAASAVASKLVIDECPDAELLYCDTLKYEHPDNRRFMADVGRWCGKEVKLLRSDKYADIFDVFRRTRWLVGVNGARCTTELKKNVRKAYQRPGDVQVFGFTADEERRVKQFYRENPEVEARFPLIERGISKAQCKRMLLDAGIALPAMYALGYKNNNCIGCVKGQQGYWNKIRVDFPEAFARMAAMERELDAAINKRYEGGQRIRVFLDELPPDAGKYDAEPDIECGVVCVHSALREAESR